MAFERFRNEHPDRYSKLEDIKEACRKLNPGEMLPDLFWLVNSFGNPVTREKKQGWSDAGDRIVFGFQNTIIRESGRAPREIPMGLEIIGRNKIADYIEHPLSEMRNVLREYGAAGFLKVTEEEGAREEVPRAPLIGAGYERLRTATENLYREQIEGIVADIGHNEMNASVSDPLFARAVSRLSAAETDSPDTKEAIISLKDTRGRNITIELKYLSNLLAPRESGADEIVLKPGLIIRMSLPERKGERAFEPHRMPDDHARIFSGLVHIIRHPDSYPKVKEELTRLGVQVIELQTREWLEPPSREQHQNMRFDYERRSL